MIRVNRPADGPAKLGQLGAPRTALDCAAYSANPAGYRMGGDESFTFRKYYSRKEVKALLATTHCDKCCYCEQKLPSRAYLHVEHYRPKSGFRQSLDSKTDERPGYYWLAYTWDNLLLACHDCNSVHKGTFFPLANPTRRARSHNDDVAKEKPLFIDPARQYPRRHIRFDGDSPVGYTEQGRETIKGMGLRRPRLREERLLRMKLIDFHFNVLKLLPEVPLDPDVEALQVEAKAFLKMAVQPDAPFSSMAIDRIKHLKSL